MFRSSDIIRCIAATSIVYCDPKLLKLSDKYGRFCWVVSKVLSVLMSCVFVAPSLDKYLFYCVVIHGAAWLLADLNLAPSALRWWENGGVGIIGKGTF